MGISSVGTNARSSVNAALESGAGHAAAMVRKAKEIEKIEGESAMKLIESAGAPAQNQGRIDTYA